MKTVYFLSILLAFAAYMAYKTWKEHRAKQFADVVSKIVVDANITPEKKESNNGN